MSHSHDHHGHGHHHHDHVQVSPTHDHRAAVLEEARAVTGMPTLIGLSAGLRLAVAAGLSLLLWFAALWAMR